MDRFTALDELKKKWTDKYVTIIAERPELKRFEGMVGRVITVNYNGKAIIDFADGAWYDVSASDEFLTEVESEDEKKKYKADVNSAQPFPTKQ